MKSWLDLIAIWVIGVTIFSAGSWLLSAFGALNPLGYFILIATITLLICLNFRPPRIASLKRTVKKNLRRLRHPLPFIFTLVCVMSFLGGALNELTNGDSIAYRIPRILHWLSEGRWHWIHAADDRLNVVGCNLEFLGAPLLLLFRDERWLFLISLSAYLFLPGLFFSFLTMVGVRGRVAWWWMWLLPLGYVYAMQSGSVATDGFSTTAALAAIVFALRGAKTRRAEDYWLALLSASFLTGIKQVTLPLCLIFLGPLLKGLPIMLRRPLKSICVLAICILASALPISIANIQHTGSWKGFSKDNPYEQKSFLWGIIGNAFVIPVQNLQPPVFPYADAWNQKMKEFVSTPLGSRFRNFEMFATLWRAPSEINAGLGFGLSVFICLTIAGLMLTPKPSRGPPITYVVPPSGGFSFSRNTTWVKWSALAAAAVWMGKSGLMQNARYFAPYYPFLLPWLLGRPGNSVLVRKKWWRHTAVATGLLLVALLLTSRQHPIWPVAKILPALTERYPNSNLLRKIERSYLFFRGRDRIITAINASIPQSATRVGYSATQGFLELGLWISAPRRKVYWIKMTDSPNRITDLALEYAIVDPTAIAKTPGKSIESWLHQFPGKIVGTIETKLSPEANSEFAYIVRF